MERVSVIGGSNRILFVAPHGGDDGKIAATAKSLAQGLEAFAVVNQGWALGRADDGEEAEMSEEVEA